MRYLSVNWAKPGRAPVCCSARKPCNGRLTRVKGLAAYTERVLAMELRALRSVALELKDPAS